MPDILIRPETPDDAAAITRVNDLAFQRPNEGRLVDNLRKLCDFNPLLSLVAELEGEVIGHLMLFPVQISSPTLPRGEGLWDMEQSWPSLSLGPIAVIPEYQKKGVGGRLITVGHQAAKELGYTSVVLLGHPSYYPKFGYKPADQWGLTNPWNIIGDPWMAIELAEGALQGKAGLVVYPEAFNEAT